MMAVITLCLILVVLFETSDEVISLIYTEFAGFAKVGCTFLCLADEHVCESTVEVGFGEVFVLFDGKCVAVDSSFVVVSESEDIGFVVVSEAEVRGELDDVVVVAEYHTAAVFAFESGIVGIGVVGVESLVFELFLSPVGAKEESDDEVGLQSDGTSAIVDG